ncbi:hypothetical protein FQA39_LY00963 [Lamprigera yunnana]|nr:hypothetical protein FQA39_LY00963 [Lamprigera yunnana]
MSHFKLQKVHNFSYLNLAGLKEQRKALLPPEENELLEKINHYYGDELPKAVYSSKFETKTPRWITKERCFGPLPKYRGKILLARTLPVEYDGVRSLKFSYDGEKLVVGYGAGNIEVVSMNDVEAAPVMIKPMQKGFPITAVRFIGDTSNFLAASFSGGLFFCTPDAQECTEFLKEDDNEINAMDVCRAGEKIITGGKDTAIRLYDLQTGQKTYEYLRNVTLSYHADGDNLYHSLHIFAVKFHPDYPELFMSGGWDGYAKVWDLRISKGCIRNFHGPYMCGSAIDAHNSEVLTGSLQWKNGIQLWDLPSGKEIKSISSLNRSKSVNGDFIHTLQYLMQDLYQSVLTGGRNPYVEIINIDEQRTIFRFPVHKSILALDTCTDYLSYGGYENCLRVVRY